MVSEIVRSAWRALELRAGMQAGAVGGAPQRSTTGTVGEPRHLLRGSVSKTVGAFAAAAGVAVADVPAESTVLAPRASPVAEQRYTVAGDNAGTPATGVAVVDPDGSITVFITATTVFLDGITITPGP